MLAFLLIAISFSSCSDYAYDPGDAPAVSDPAVSAVTKNVTITPTLTFQTLSLHKGVSETRGLGLPGMSHPCSKPRSGWQVQWDQP